MRQLQWLKTRVGLFLDPRIQYLLSQPNGDSYVVLWFYLKDVAGIMNDDGRVYVATGVPLTARLIAKAMHRSKGFIEKALAVLEQIELIYRDDDGAIVIAIWDELQDFKKDERRRAQTRERVARYRRRQLVKKNDTCHDGIVPMPADGDRCDEGVACDAANVTYHTTVCDTTATHVAESAQDEPYHVAYHAENGAYYDTHRHEYDVANHAENETCHATYHSHVADNAENEVYHDTGSSQYDVAHHAEYEAYDDAYSRDDLDNVVNHADYETCHATQHMHDVANHAEYETGRDAYMVNHAENGAYHDTAQESYAPTPCGEGDAMTAVRHYEAVYDVTATDYVCRQLRHLSQKWSSRAVCDAIDIASSNGVNHTYYIAAVLNASCGRPRKREVTNEKTLRQQGEYDQDIDTMLQKGWEERRRFLHEMGHGQ